MTGHSSCEAACMRTLVLALALAAAGSVARAEAPSAWEAESPVAPLPSVPLGVNGDLSELPYKPTPEKVRLGRWLFYDKRLSKDSTRSCASSHVPEHAFSELTPHSTGVGGKTGTPKSPTFVNPPLSTFPASFSDGLAASPPSPST